MNFDKRGGNVNGCFCCPPCFPPCMGFPGWNGYMSSKMSNHLWSKHYAENIIDNNKLNLLVVDPGVVLTGIPIFDHIKKCSCSTFYGAVLYCLLKPTLARSPHTGSYVIYRGVTSKSLEKYNGKFVESGPFGCACDCPIQNIGCSRSFCFFCMCLHSTKQAKPLYEHTLNVENELREKYGIKRPNFPVVNEMKRGDDV